jgi:hypothetical protein
MERARGARLLPAEAGFVRGFGPFDQQLGRDKRAFKADLQANVDILDLASVLDLLVVIESFRQHRSPFVELCHPAGMEIRTGACNWLVAS